MGISQRYHGVRPAEGLLYDIRNLTQLKQKSADKYPLLIVQSVEKGAGTKWTFIL